MKLIGPRLICSLGILWNADKLFLPFRASTVTYDHVWLRSSALQRATSGSVRQLRIWIVTKAQKAKAQHEWLISFDSILKRVGWLVHSGTR